MISIRHITNDEAEDFLDLLCRVFSLDIDRARHVFFNEPLFDLRRKWAVFDGAEMVSILSTAPVEFGWGHAIGIAGVATEPSRRREGLAGKMLEVVLREARKEGVNVAYLFAADPSLYERNGFKIVDEVVRGPIIRGAGEKILAPASSEDVRRIYTQWSTANSNRLLRDTSRWRLWHWTLRLAYEFRSGYFCVEGNIMREAIVDGKHHGPWPTPPGVEWYGLGSMAEKYKIPMQDRRKDLYMMAFGVSEPPEMFLTDQF